MQAIPIPRNPNMLERQIYRIAIDRIRANPYQPRQVFEEEALAALADSIRIYGLLQPISVRRTGPDSYELIAGERRLRASRMLGLLYIDAIILTAYEQDAAVIALIENIQRENLDYLEEAESYGCLVRDHGMTQEELAKRLGRSTSAVANKLRLLKLSPAVQKALRSSGLTERHARALLRLCDEAQQLRILHLAQEGGLTVRATEQLIEQQLNQPQKRARAIVHCRDLRPYFNSMKDIVGQMRDAGLDAQITQSIDGDLMTVQVQVKIAQGRVRRVD